MSKTAPSPIDLSNSRTLAELLRFSCSVRRSIAFPSLSCFETAVHASRVVGDQLQATGMSLRHVGSAWWVYSQFVPRRWVLLI